MSKINIGDIFQAQNLKLHVTKVTESKIYIKVVSLVKGKTNWFFAEISPENLLKNTKIA